MKKVVSIVLLLSMMLTMVGQLPVQAEAVTEDVKTQIRRQVSDEILRYANSVLNNEAAEDAITDFGMHALFGGGAYRKIDEKNPIVSSMFNAKLFQDSLVEALTAAFVSIQELHLSEMYVSGAPHWHSYNDSYSYSAFMGSEKDNSRRLGTLISCKQATGSSTYTGAMNRNDQAMQILVGSLKEEMVISRSETKKNTIVYNVRLKISDDFDFDSNYSAAEKNNYDASLDKALVNIGRLMNRFAIETFEWEFVKEFRFEVPNSCDHTAGGYCWVLDGDSKQLNAVSDGYLVNHTRQLTYTNTQTGKVSYYYLLDRPITLRHDMPWVVEYEAYKLSGLALAPSNTTTSLPFLRQSSRSYIWSQQYEYIPKENTPDGKTSYIYHYMVAKLLDQYKYYSKHTYTYRLENVVNPDGSNMIWVSVYDNDLEKTVLEPIPTDVYMTQKKGEKTRTLVSEDHNGVSGKDFIINYIGNKSYRLSVEKLTLRIWENGENNAQFANVISTHKAISCTEDGYTLHVCRDCGYSYTSDVEKAPGHSYGEYISDNNASCEKDGTMTAACSSCGYTDTVTDSGTATGHNVVHQEAVEPDCDTSGLSAGSYCSVCDAILAAQEVIPAKGHTTVTDEGADATCTESGMTEGSHCSVCDAVITAQEVIPAKGHTPVIDKGVDATCTESGMTEGSHCAACDAVITEQEVIPAKGHTPVTDAAEEATCTTTGLTEGIHCDVCDAVITAQEEIPMAEHSFGAWTAVEGGRERRECGNCGHSQTRHAEPETPDLSVSGDSVSGKPVLNWNQVENAAEYQIYRKIGKNGTYVKLAAVTGTSYMDETAKAGTKYYYRIRTVSAKGIVSPYSSGKARTCDLPRPEVEESNVSSSGAIKLKWEKIEGAEKYKIYRRVGKSGDYEYYKTTSDNEYTDKDTTPGIVYYYKVKAVHANTGANSAKSSGVGQTCKLERPNVSIKLSSGNPKLTWDEVEGAKEYKIYRATSKNGTYKLVKTTTGEKFTDKSVKEGKTYYYKVKAIHSKSSANSAYSSIDSIKAK